MKTIRNMFCVLAALMLAAFAMPASADKVFEQTMSSSPSPLKKGGSGQSASMTLNNISDTTGNSTVKSFKLNAPSGFTITAPASGVAVPVGGGYTATIQNNGTSIWLSNINIPLKPFGTPLTLNMTVNVSCTPDLTGTWTMLGVWNGTTFTGQTFAFTNTAQFPSVVTTPVSGVCGSIAFVTQPATTFAGYPITTTAFNNPQGSPVAVQLLFDGSPAPDGTIVTLAVSAGTCSISSGGSASTSGGVATFSNLTSSAGTGCKLTASTAAGGGVGPSAPSSAFDIEAPDGTLSCTNTGNTAGALDPDAIPPFAPPGQPPLPADWGLKRGENRDGTCGPNVPFTFTIDGTTNTALFTEDSLGQATSVEYIIRWAPVNVDGDVWSAKQPCVSWGVTNPVYQVDVNGVCFGDYVPALACLVNDVNAPGDGVQVMPFIPALYPYQGGEPQYTPGLRAKVCVAQQGWNSVNGQVQYWTKLIDQSDTGIRLP